MGWGGVGWGGVGGGALCNQCAAHSNKEGCAVWRGRWPPPCTPPRSARPHPCLLPPAGAARAALGVGCCPHTQGRAHAPPPLLLHAHPPLLLHTCPAARLLQVPALPRQARQLSPAAGAAPRRCLRWLQRTPPPHTHTFCHPQTAPRDVVLALQCPQHPIAPWPSVHWLLTPPATHTLAGGDGAGDAGQAGEWMGGWVGRVGWVGGWGPAAAAP